MKKIFFVLGLFLFCPQLAEAQSQRNPCYYPSATSTSCIPVSTTNPLPVTGGGGGSGGTSALDASAFTTGTTPITPMGGLYNDSSTLTSGQIGAPRLTTKRAIITDVDTTGSALYSAITSGVGTPGSAVPSTGIYLGGNVSTVFRGWTGVNPTGTVYAQQNDIASVGGTVVGTYGSTPGAVPAAPVNANVTNTVTVTSTTSYGAAQLSHQVLSFSSSGNNIAITRAVGTIKVYQLELSCASNLTTITPQDGTVTSLGAKSATQYIYEGLQTEPIYTTTGTNNFVINLSAGVTCTGFAKYKDT